MSTCINGSDLLLYVDGKAIASCTSHTTTFSTETKDRAIKPLASVTSRTSGLWQNKGVAGLSISIAGEGLCFYEDTEADFGTLLALWKAGASITVKCCERTTSSAPYLQGSFVITNLEQSAPARDDASYSISLENDGEPTVLDGTKFAPASANE